MVLETSRGILQSLPGDGASWEGRALWFVGPRRRETTTMVRRSLRVRAGALGLRGRLALGAGSPRDGRSGAFGSWSCGLGALGGGGRGGSSLLHQLFSSCSTRGLLLLQDTSFSLWLLLLQSTRFRSMGFSSCGTRGLVSLQHVGSSQSRAQTHVPCIDRRILYH